MSVTAAQVATWGKFTLPSDGSDERALLDLVVSAVVEHISEFYCVEAPFSPAQQIAALMQSARVWRRRDTPEGVVAFDELGAIRVTRLDPDVAALLTRKVVIG